MKLPNADQALVEQPKVADYLLNAAHPDNGGKAKFFEGLGFRRDNWRELATALGTLAQQGEVLQTETTAHGRKYVILGGIESPTGQMATVQTIWIMDTGSDVPRLVTAYPAEK